MSTTTNTKSILIVDDDAFARYSLQMTLKKAGFEVMEVEMGPRALVLLRVYRPGIVLCVHRQGMEGLSVLRKLQFREEGGNYSFLLLTADIDRSRLPISCQGIDEFVLLPVDEEALIETLESHDGSVLVDRRGVSRNEEAAPIELGRHPDSSQKYLRFHAFNLELDRRAQDRLHHAGPEAQVHANQIGVIGAMAANRMGRGTNLNCYLDRGFLPLHLDELHVIVTELIENACRFSAPQTGIDLFFLKEEGGDEIYVRDHGQGMTSERIQSLGVFAGKNPGLTFDRESEGFGLPMVKLITQKRGGTFWISSTIGVGTTVRVQLPAGVRRQGSAGGKAGDMGIPPLNFD